MLKKIHPAIQYILVAHGLFWLSSNLLLPFISVFYVNEINGCTLTEVGFATLLYFLTYGLTTPFIGRIADRIPGLKDELIFVVSSYILRGSLFILFSYATELSHLYAFQILLGLSRGLAGK